jgi:beta-glucosidase
VLTHGRPVTFGSDYGGSLTSQFTSNGAAPLDQRAAAVLATWRSGEEGGNAMWQLLTGVASPSGRLPQQWPISVGGVRVGGVGDYLIKYSDQGGAGWTLGAPFTPNYPFGFGLDYLDVSVAASSAEVDTAAQSVNVSVALANAAPTAGLYVVEVRLFPFLRGALLPQTHKRVTSQCVDLFQPSAVPLHPLPAHACGIYEGSR